MRENELAAVEAFEDELRERLYRQYDEDRLSADLAGLYVEIIGVISKTDREKAGIIHDYAKLLEQELQLYSGKDAYIAGREAKGKSENDAYFHYIKKVAAVNNSMSLDARLQVCRTEIAGLLGCNKGLIAEFTDTYRLIHGAVKNNIAEFISIGQASGETEAAK